MSEQFEELVKWLKTEIARLEKCRPRTPSGYREEDGNQGRLLALGAALCRAEALRDDRNFFSCGQWRHCVNGISELHPGKRADCPICQPNLETKVGDHWGGAGNHPGSYDTCEICHPEPAGNLPYVCPLCGACCAGKIGNPWRAAFEELIEWINAEIARLEKWRPRTPSGYRDADANRRRLLTLRQCLCRAESLRDDCVSAQ